MPLLSDYDCLRVLDLGCGIGRNSLYIAENYRNKCCMVDCVDILDIAIENLKSNTRTHGVEKKNKWNTTALRMLECRHCSFGKKSLREMAKLANPNNTYKC